MAEIRSRAAAKLSEFTGVLETMYTPVPFGQHEPEGAAVTGRSFRGQIVSED
ncbi:MAG TPA: hypothetical protein PK003_10330 [Bacillota bacterium]|nr:hypothetical protein [Bacillota bacterium]